MRTLTFVSLVTLLLGTTLLSLNAEKVIAKERATTKQCARWQHSLIKVNKKLRSGYTAKEGNKLRKQRRALESKIQTYCK